MCRDSPCFDHVVNYIIVADRTIIRRMLCYPLGLISAVLRVGKDFCQAAWKTFTTRLVYHAHQDLGNGAKRTAGILLRRWQCVEHLSQHVYGVAVSISNFDNIKLTTLTNIIELLSNPWFRNAIVVVNEDEIGRLHTRIGQQEHIGKPFVALFPLDEAAHGLYSMQPRGAVQLVADLQAHANVHECFIAPDTTQRMGFDSILSRSVPGGTVCQRKIARDLVIILKRDGAKSDSKCKSNVEEASDQ